MQQTLTATQRLMSRCVREAPLVQRKPSTGPIRPVNVRFIDGTHAQIVIDSPTDILLSPVFLKYMFFCIAVYSLLNSDPWDVGALSPWELMMLWSLVTATVIVWYVGALRVTHWLLTKGWIKTVFTPLIILPSLPLLQFLTYGVSVSLHDTYIPSADVIRTAIKDVFVLALFDMAFGSFVAPQHPAFICDHGNRTSGAPDADTGPSPRAILPTKPVAARGEVSFDAPSPDADANTIVTIAGARFDRKDLVLLRSEDHYLQVVTQDRRVMLRGELGKVVETLDETIGFRINRSVWIAFSAIAEVHQEAGRQIEIRLKNGDLYQVSKYRRVAFLNARKRVTTD